MTSGPSRVRLARFALGIWCVALAVGTHWPRLQLAGGAGDGGPLLGVDKWAHVLGYAGLASLLTLARLFHPTLRWDLMIGGVVLVAFSAADEATQALVVGRIATLADWTASAIGIAAGLAVGGGWLRLRRDASAPSSASAGTEAAAPATRSARGAEELSSGTAFARHTRLISLLTASSRVLGLFREVALARVFGLGSVMDAFVVAFMIPNLFRRLFGEGALAAAFIPRYSKLCQTDDTAASDVPARFAGAVLSLALGTLAAITVVGVGALATLLAAGVVGEKWLLTAGLARVTLWYAPLICGVALLGAMLQVHGRFGPPAAAPVVLNLTIIAATAIVGYVPPVAERLSPTAAIYLVGVAMVISGLVQAAWQWAALRHAAAVTVRWPDVRGRSELRRPIRDLLKQWGPTAAGLAVLQLNALADLLIAKAFSAGDGEAFALFGATVAYPMETGAAATLAATTRLYEFPLGVFGLAVSTALFPAFSAAAEDEARFGALLRRGLRLTLYIGLPASVGLVLVREPLARAIYYPGGALQSVDWVRIAAVLFGYAPAVWAYSLNHVLTRAFYAKDDPLTPVRVMVGMVGLNVALNLTLIWPMGLPGLAWSTASCAVVQCGLLLWRIRRAVAVPLDRRVVASWGRSVACTAAMAAGVGSLLSAVAVDGLSWPTTVLLLLASATLGVALVAACSVLVGAEEWRWLLGREVEPEER